MSAQVQIMSNEYRKTSAERRRLTASAERDSMRRFPNGNSGQSRWGLSSAASRLASPLRDRWRPDHRHRDLFRPRPLAGGGRPAREIQGDHRAQRRDPAARRRGRETLPRRIRAGNLAYPTVDEIKAVAAALTPGKDGAVIIVTTKAHTRRVRLLWRRLAPGQSQAIVRAAAGDPFDSRHWWRTTSDALDVVREVLGLLNAWAGLPLHRAH